MGPCKRLECSQGRRSIGVKYEVVRINFGFLADAASNQEENTLHKAFSTLSVTLLASAITFASLSAATPEKKQKGNTGVNGRNESSPVILQEVDVPRHGDLLVIPVRLQSRQCLFALDTGSGTTILDSSLRGAVGNRIGTVRMPQLAGPIDVFESPEVRVGSHRLSSSQGVILVDLSLLRTYSGHDVFGILGMDFLNGEIIQVDFDAGKLRFLRKDGRASGTPLEVTYGKDGVPHVCVSVSPGEAHPFIVDTAFLGSGSGSLDPDVLQALVSRGAAIRMGESAEVGLAGVSEVRQDTRINALTIGGYELRKLTFQGARPNRLGLDFLAHFVLTLDLDNDILYLSKGTQFHRSEHCCLSGLQLVRKERRTVVDTVAPKGAGAMNGIQVGDEIVTIRGQPAGKWTLFELMRTLDTPGDTVSLTIRRGRAQSSVEWRIARDAPR